MKVVHLSTSLSRCAGGIFEIENALVHYLNKLEINCRVLGLKDSFWELDSHKWLPIVSEACNVFGPRTFGYSLQLKSKLFFCDADIGHLHDLWTYPSLAICQWSKFKNKPYIVTPNGMLEPWALKNSYRKKRLASFFYQNNVLSSANCLQANTVKELNDFRSYGLNNPIAVIPNGVNLPNISNISPKDDIKILLFLGRLHPKKGIMNAIRAWAESEIKKEWRFVIAGWDQNKHELDLKSLCDYLNISYVNLTIDCLLNQNYRFKKQSASIIFLGPVFGYQKDLIFRMSSAFILPSYSEGLPMSILEAWSYQIPVLMTDSCNLPEGFKSQAAIQIGTDVLSIYQGLNFLFESSPSTLLEFGINGRLLVQRQFSWSLVAKEMKKVYQWILGEGIKPKCIDC